ncbi:MAG: hypothetical protein JRC59_08525 [Deltaproteobacteria bacterium]|nr:hypothetical protein [Deltaproteobacteria bacterium]
MEKVVGVFQGLKTNINDSTRLAPKIVRKPKLFLYWLFSARWAQLVLLLVVLGLPKFIPSIVDTQLEQLYPPIIEKKYWGLIKNARPDPLLESRQKIARIAMGRFWRSCYLPTGFAHSAGDQQYDCDGA